MCCGTHAMATPNKRFEGTAASALAVPLSLRSSAAPQARRWASQRREVA